MNFTTTAACVLSCLISLILSSPLLAEEIAASLANELASQVATIKRQAGGYLATVTAADPIFNVPVGSKLTVVVVPSLDAGLGHVGIAIGQETIPCVITTAQGGMIGFNYDKQPRYLLGLIRIDAAGAPKQLVLTRGTLDGLSSLEADMQRIPEPE